MTSTSATTRRRGLLTRLYHGETKADFIGRWKLWFGLSGAVILIGLAALFTRGLNLGIDFTGGNVWEMPARNASVDEASRAVEALGISDTKVQSVGQNLRVQTPPFTGTAAEQERRSAEVVTALSRVTGVSRAEVEANQDTVGPTWGQEISSKALRALAIFLVAIAAYITLRFELRMAIATLAALLHDLLVVLGVYALLQLPVTPPTVIAILTILGFSIYDGIVVFDRVDENTRMLSSGARMTYTDMTNLSLNQVLMRSLNTQVTALLPIVAVLVIGSLVLGATTLQEFGLALFVGQLSGAYSSIFIASPVLALLKEREPRYRALRRRLEERGERAGRRQPNRAELEAELATSGETDDAAGDGADEAVVGARAGARAARRAAGSRSATATAPASSTKPRPSSANRPGTYSANHPPRPRKKGKKR